MLVKILWKYIAIWTIIYAAKVSSRKLLEYEVYQEQAKGVQSINSSLIYDIIFKAVQTLNAYFSLKQQIIPQYATKEYQDTIYISLRRQIKQYGVGVYPNPGIYSSGGGASQSQGIIVSSVLLVLIIVVALFLLLRALRVRENNLRRMGQGTQNASARQLAQNDPNSRKSFSKYQIRGKKYIYHNRNQQQDRNLPDINYEKQIHVKLSINMYEYVFVKLYILESKNKQLKFHSAFQSLAMSSKVDPFSSPSNNPHHPQTNFDFSNQQGSSNSSLQILSHSKRSQSQQCVQQYLQNKRNKSGELNNSMFRRVSGRLSSTATPNPLLAHNMSNHHNNNDNQRNSNNNNNSINSSNKNDGNKNNINSGSNNANNALTSGQNNINAFSNRSFVRISNQGSANIQNNVKSQIQSKRILTMSRRHSMGPQQSQSLSAMGSADYEKVCLVCLDDFEEGDVIIQPSCQHKYHDRCLESWLHRGHPTCPICRQEFEMVQNERLDKPELSLQNSKSVQVYQMSRNPNINLINVSQSVLPNQLHSTENNAISPEIAYANNESNRNGSIDNRPQNNAVQQVSNANKFRAFGWLRRPRNLPAGQENPAPIEQSSPTQQQSPLTFGNSRRQVANLRLGTRGRGRDRSRGRDGDRVRASRYDDSSSYSDNNNLGNNINTSNNNNNVSNNHNNVHNNNSSSTGAHNILGRNGSNISSRGNVINSGHSNSNINYNNNISNNMDREFGRNSNLQIIDQIIRDDSQEAFLDTTLTDINKTQQLPVEV